MLTTTFLLISVVDFIVWLHKNRKQNERLSWRNSTAKSTFLWGEYQARYKERKRLHITNEGNLARQVVFSLSPAQLFQFLLRCLPSSYLHFLLRYLKWKLKRSRETLKGACCWLQLQEISVKRLNDFHSMFYIVSNVITLVTNHYHNLWMTLDILDDNRFKQELDKYLLQLGFTNDKKSVKIKIQNEFRLKSFS